MHFFFIYAFAEEARWSPLLASVPPAATSVRPVLQTKNCRGISWTFISTHCKSLISSGKGFKICGPLNLQTIAIVVCILDGEDGTLGTTECRSVQVFVKISIPKFGALHYISHVQNCVPLTPLL